MTRDAIKALQLLLKASGFDPGPIDGLWGAKTSAAASAYLTGIGQVTSPVEVKPTTGGMIYQGSSRYPAQEICIHCTATTVGWMAQNTLLEQVAEIRRWHIQDRGWRDIGYHWVIGRAGQVLPGRAETEIGAGVEGHNRGVIHVTLVGGYESSETDPFLKSFTPAQDSALRDLIKKISGRTQIKLISGHNQYAAKACPGFFVPQWLKEA